ncbi:MAG: hypothetical protein DRJ02_01235 [Bacteroidetes bacterium]|nr:MAG: hypothetical protein DRI72_07505 [Bacteroidota bacterium]RLD89491.1 MAG: hypothetical protein DRJ02_01235 [Bacteroidota bacterium]
MRFSSNILLALLFLLSFVGLNAQEPVFFSVDTARSKVAWSCDLHRGYFKLDSGRLEIAKGKLTGGEFTICMESITDTDIDYELMRITLLNTLKSKDFLYTAKYHYTTFVIDEVTVQNDSAYISGDLTFLGVTKCITFTAAVGLANDTLQARSQEIIIDRTDFGNTTMSKEDAKSDKSFIVPNEVTIKVSIVASIAK